MSYELFQQGPAVYIPILLLSLVITVVVYGAFPFVFAKVRNTPITKKKYRRLCYGINVAVMFLFIVINGEASSGGPYLLWTWIFSSWGTRILEDKGLLTDCSYISNKRPQPSEQDTPTFNADKIRFCRKCGQKLVAGSLYCHNCGEKVIYQ